MRLALALSFTLLLPFAGCSESDNGTDIEETAQQLGDMMASLDESSGNTSGTLSRLEGEYRTFARVMPTAIGGTSIGSLVLPSAQAADCVTASNFGTCSVNTITRTFNGCTIGGATLNGTVTLTWGGSSTSCQMNSAGATVARSPNFTITGRRSATLSVSKSSTTGTGQQLIWVSGSGTSKVFTFTSDGIRRVITVGGSTPYDFTTATTSAITITGTTRASRVMTGGAVRVTDNLTSVTCDYSPSNVTWSSSSCNCPTSGSWSGSCSNGKTSALTITGCGTATYTLGDQSQSFSFDRCSGS